MIFDEPAGPDAYLGSFSELREQGLLEETEFQRLRKALAKETLAREAGDSTAGETTTEQTTSEQTASDAGEDTLGGDPAENTPDAENRSAGPENPVDESGNRERI